MWSVSPAPSPSSRIEAPAALEEAPELPIRARQTEYAREHLQAPPYEQRHCDVPKDERRRRRERGADEPEIMDEQHAQNGVEHRADDDERGALRSCPVIVMTW